MIGAAVDSQTGPAPTGSDLWTPSETSTFLRTPEETLRWWRLRRVGFGPPSFKIGRRVMYRRQDVESWLEAQIDKAAS